ncbi:ATP-dependent metallopeptidase FtsH/Yme1/Tma family protein [Yasminevirus sp. GU-2018]|uniref:ATP-dependent metallopeptidase FtsH/Yme1/Tma family protein n=1 Tax=Yasminevirus sp. GU-2018 TaxID=2420051 RepID=A0A5K0U8B2_9VIRU|nr:ATP-dependent metallopeptidase FtsH/Yme1/Tma family protein [Yasminevirus sp. GU-2018]
MGFLSKLIYLIFSVYVLVSLYSFGVNEYNTMQIVTTHETALKGLLEDKNYVLDWIKVDRTNNHGVFFVNHTYTVTETIIERSSEHSSEHNSGLAHNYADYGVYDDNTGYQYKMPHVDRGSVTDNSSTNGIGNNTVVTTRNITKTDVERYRLLLPNEGADRIIAGFMNSSHPIKVVYFDRTNTFYDSWVIKTAIQYFVMFIVLRILLSATASLMSVDTISSGGSDTENSAVSKVTTKFTDVVGLIEAKKQIQKYVDIMKNREKYAKIGATIPKGVLLCGPPGCGKTLLAKAVAGEAGVKFFSVCGSDFDEVFVGVGASRVRKLFSTARENTPCIVFIDEIDSIGEKRKTVSQRGSDTLNKILAEMDGFKPRENIMVMASTNRETSLDSALLRSGRFDSKIYIDPPNRRERTELFKLYLAKIKIAPSLVLDDLAEKLSRTAPGATGADVSNICNQAAINAASDNSDFVRDEDLSKAVDDVMIGIEKKSKKCEKDELITTAYHEAGHALMGYVLKEDMPPMKLSIIPRGHGIAGYTLPQENELSNRTKTQMLSQVYGLLGGRGAELVKFNVLSTGASNDFEKATNIVTAMVTKYGLYPEFSQSVYELSRESPYCVSEQKRIEIENFVQKELQKAFSNVIMILKKYSKELDKLAQKLLEDEIVDYAQIKEILPKLENVVSLTVRDTGVVI